MIPSYFTNLVSKGAEICRGCYYSTLDFTLKDLLAETITWRSTIYRYEFVIRLSMNYDTKNGNEFMMHYLTSTNEIQQ